MKLPKGTRDIFGDDARMKHSIIDTCRDIFEKYDAEPMNTPVFELRETLNAKYGEENQRLMYDLADQGGDILSLRYDLTVPLARHIATHGVRNFTRYQIGDVYRRDNPQPLVGRFREFTQADFDIIGPSTAIRDALLIRVACDVFRQLVPDFKLILNHRVLLYDCLSSAGIPEFQFKTVCSSIDKLDKLTWSEVQSELLSKGLTVTTCEQLQRFIAMKGDYGQILDTMKDLLSENQGLNRLIELERILVDLGVLQDIVLDMSLARGVDYYTGIIFEVKCPNGKSIGSLGAGGRYDDLIGDLCGSKVPAAGFSVGIDRVMMAKDKNPTELTGAVYVIPLIESAVGLACQVSRTLWDWKIKTSLSDVTKPARGIHQATKQKASFVVVIGQKEVDENTVTIKDLASQQQTCLPYNKLKNWCLAKSDNQL